MKNNYSGQSLGRPVRLLGGGLCLVLLALPGLAQTLPQYPLPLNGSTQCAAVPNSPTLEVAAGTVELWVKPTWAPGSYNGANPGFIGERTPNNRSTRFSLHITDRLNAVGIWNNGQFLTVPYAFTQGQWYHLAAVMAPNRTEFFVNGASVGSVPEGINTSLTGTILCLGSSSPLATYEAFKGEIDEVRVWSTARTAAQLQAGMQAPLASPTTTAGLVAYYPIDQDVTGAANATAALLKDYAANGLNGKLYNYWAPALASFAPASGSAGTTVVLTGTYLDGATDVTFDGVAANFVVNSATQLTATVPDGATTGSIQVVAASGTATSGQVFTVLPGDLTVSDTQYRRGAYHNVTVVSGGSLTLTDDLDVTGTLTVQEGGQLNLQTSTVTGSGFVLAPGGTLRIGSSAGIAAAGSTGGIQTTARTFAPEADYVYGSDQPGSETGSGLPAQVRSLRVVDLLGSGSAYLQLTNDLAISQVLQLDYDLDTRGKTLTLLSTPQAGSALVHNNGGVVQGAATVQRAFDPSLNGGLGYRHLSAPVSHATVADLATGSFAPVVNPAYNTSATPAAETPFPTVYGYDQSRLTLANNLGAFDKGWVSPAALTDELAVGRGYTAHLGAGELVRFVGTLNNGDQTLPLARNSGSTAADAGWQLLGNPYPAPLDLSLVEDADRPGLDAAVYVSESLSAYAGQYRAYVNGLSSGSSGNSVVPSGQGFFVRVSAGQTSGSFTFRNSQRLTSFDATGVRRTTADARPQLRLALRGSAGSSDAACVYFERGATAGFDGQYDAAKLPNTTGLNLNSVAASGQALAIDGRPLPAATLSIPLRVAVPASGTYTLQADQLLNLGSLHPYLRDLQLGTLTDLAQQPRYTFRQDAASAEARFELVLQVPQALATAAAAQAQVAVYPNPAQTVAYVELPAALGAQPVAAALLDALGRPVLTATLPAQGAQMHQLSLGGVPAGVYALCLRTSAGLVTKRLVIQ